MQHSKNIRFAGFWLRLASRLVDSMSVYFVYLVFFTLFFVLFYNSMTSAEFLSAMLKIFFPAILVALFVYDYLTTTHGRYSLGKKLFRLRIVNKQMEPLSGGSAAKRTLLFLLDTIFLGVGHLFALFSPQKQALHDLLAGTYVIREERTRKNATDIVIVFFCVIAFYFIATLYLKLYFQAYSMPTTAMQPTVQLGDYFLTDKYWPSQNAPQQGDLILFKYPWDERIEYLDRCIALEGQTVKVRNDTFFIDGEPEGEYHEIKRGADPLLGTQTRDIQVTTKNKKYLLRFFVEETDTNDDFEPLTVPEGHCFVLGDFRDNSADSRAWGFVPYENIIAKAGVVYLSLDRSHPFYHIKNALRLDRIGIYLN